MIQCIKKWKHKLSYHPFEVHTDASTLKYLTTMKNQSDLFKRWYQEIASLNFTVIHKKGKENNNADTLSRSSHMAEALPLEVDEYVEFYEKEEPVIKLKEEGMKFSIYSTALLKLPKNNPR